MGIKKIKAEITKMSNKAYGDGYADAEREFQEREDEVWDNAVREGMWAERNRIRSILKNFEDIAIEEANGKDIEKYRGMRTLLCDVARDPRLPDLTPEEVQEQIDQWRREDEERYG